MDAYFPKIRRPLEKGSPIKRAPASCADEPAAKFQPTPKNSRLLRPQQPPPVKRKLPTLSPTRASTALASASSPNAKKRPITARELFKTVHPIETKNSDKTTKLFKTKPPDKITSGPLKGIETSLLDLIRKKEADAKNVDPQMERKRELLGIAPEIVRIVPTIFVANKKEVLPYDRVVDKCFRGLKSNYTTPTIIECLQLLDKVAPEWITVVQITRGKFMRFNKDKYTIPQLVEAIKRFKQVNFN